MTITSCLKGVGFLLLGIYSLTAMAEEKLQLKPVTITGNQELPKVLYILPCKAMPGSQYAQPLSLPSINEEVREILDPETFDRKMEYQYMYSGSGKLDVE